MELSSNRRINHRHDIACDRITKISFVAASHQEDRFANARISQQHCFVQLDHCKPEYRLKRLQQSRDIYNTQAISIVLDDCQNRPRIDTPMNLSCVMTNVIRSNLNPGIIEGIQNGNWRSDGSHRG